MQTDPATVEDMFGEVRLSSKVIFPRGSINDLQPLISDRPVDAEVGSFPRLPCFCVTNTCTWEKKQMWLGKELKNWSNQPFIHSRWFTTKKGSVKGERLGQIFHVWDALVHGSGKMVGMVQTSQN